MYYLMTVNLLMLREIASNIIIFFSQIFTNFEQSSEKLYN